VIPLHPETTEDGDVLLWRVTHALATSRSQGVADDPVADAESLAAAEPLRRLVDEGALSAFAVLDTGILTTLGAGRTWAQAAPAVRRAVQLTVADHAERLGAAGPSARDAVLARIARQAIVDVVGPAAAAHGGGIELVGARDGVVSVRTHGACHGCPAATMTLHGLLAGQVRRRAPWLVDVHETG
jgi:Fe-S cluster biogenesis protein NfuA